MPTDNSLEREWLILIDGLMVDDEAHTAAMCPVCNALYPVGVIFTLSVCPECHTRMVTLKGNSRDEQRNI